jgi:hypothetical protein
MCVCVQGAGPTILKLTLNMGMRFTFFGWLRERAVQLNGGAPMSDLQSFLAGGVSGAVSVVVNHPVDVVVRAKAILTLVLMSGSISFTRAQGIP